MKIYRLAIPGLTFIFLLCQTISAQSFSVGAKVGGGSISGRSVSIATYTSSLFFEFNLPFSNVVNFRTGFLYMEDFEILLPDTRVPYHPFFRGVYLQGVMSQPLSESFFLEEAAGITAINDRTFSDVNDWGYGVTVSFAGGIDLRGFGEKGFLIGLGSEYGITFTNTLPQFFGMYLFGRYVF